MDGAAKQGPISYGRGLAGMDMELLKNMVVNAAILTVTSVPLIHSHNKIRMRRRLLGIVTGAIVGLIGMLLLWQSASYDPTHMLNAQNVLMGAVAMFTALFRRQSAWGC